MRANFVDRDGNPAASHESDLLIGADGIHSVVRARFYPDEGMPIWNGVTMWRGVTEGKPFLSGADMVQAGHRNQKFVVYPISRRHAERGAALINWIADLRQDGKQLLRREDWNKPGELAEFLPRFEGWRFPFLDVPGIMRAGGIPESSKASIKARRSDKLSELASELVPKNSSPAFWAISQRQCATKRCGSGERSALNGVTTGARTPRIRVCMTGILSCGRVGALLDYTAAH